MFGTAGDGARCQLDNFTATDIDSPPGLGAPENVGLLYGISSPASVDVTFPTGMSS